MFCRIAHPLGFSIRFDSGSSRKSEKMTDVKEIQPCGKLPRPPPAAAAGRVVVADGVEGVTKCLIWSGEATEDDATMFPTRLRKAYAEHQGVPPHMEQHFYICDATAPALVQHPKAPEQPITVDSVRQSRLLWTWLRREATLDQAMEGKILRERRQRLAKRGRLQEYQHVEMQPLCRLRAHLPPPVNHFKRASQQQQAAEAPSSAAQLPQVAGLSPRATSAGVKRPAAYFAVPANPTTSHHHPPASPRTRPLSSTVKRKIVEMAERFGA
jgi:hypothetical protein